MPDELVVLQVKYSAPLISRLSDEEVSANSELLLLKIHAITGWIIPGNEILTILLEQFAEKLKESFPNCNTKEIEYAFRTHGSAVKDWGKQMNLSLIDEVMGIYLEQRAQISRMEESLKTKPTEQKPFDDEAYNDALRGNAEQWYQWILLGKIKYAPEGMKEILVKDNFLTKEADISDFLVDWIGKGNKHLYTK